MVRDVGGIGSRPPPLQDRPQRFQRAFGQGGHRQPEVAAVVPYDAADAAPMRDHTDAVSLGDATFREHRGDFHEFVIVVHAHDPALAEHRRLDRV
jgi:hypothetical protein